MADDDDPRIYFAAERTLLAWIRTGLTVIGLGFVVARFGLFLRVIRNSPDASAHAGSTWIGVGLVLLGAAAIGMAAWQHVQFCRGLAPTGLPRPNTMRWSVSFAALLSIIGAALAAYLLLGSNGTSAPPPGAYGATRASSSRNGESLLLTTGPRETPQMSDAPVDFGSLVRRAC